MRQNETTAHRDAARLPLLAGVVGAGVIVVGILLSDFGVPAAVAKWFVAGGTIGVGVSLLATVALAVLWFTTRVLRGVAGAAQAILAALVAEISDCFLLILAALARPAITACRLQAAQPITPPPRLARLLAGTNRPPRALLAR